MLRSLITKTPLRLIAVFWIAAVALFFFDAFGAYSRAPNKLLLFAFMALHILMILGIDAIRTPVIPAVMVKETSARKFFFASLIISLLMLPMNIYYYSGSQVTDFLSLLTNPVEAYGRMQLAAGIDRTERIDFLALKLVLSWLTVATVPLALILRHQRLISMQVFLIALAISFVFSVFRGTDKEIGDILIFVIASWFLTSRKNDTVELKERKKGFRLFSKQGLFIIAAISIFLYLFGFRKGERMANMTLFCYAGTDVCQIFPSNDASPLAFLAMIIYGYLTHGFYGLASSFDSVWSPCPLIGHSSVFMFLGSLGGATCENTMMDQLNSLGWTSRGAWSTGFVQLANDFGHIATYFQVATFAFALKIFHRTFTQKGCYISGVLFMLNFFILFYMVGNLQLQQAGDQYFGYIFLNIAALVSVFLKNQKSA